MQKGENVRIKYITRRTYKLNYTFYEQQTLGHLLFKQKNNPIKSLVIKETRHNV